MTCSFAPGTGIFIETHRARMSEMQRVSDRVLAPGQKSNEPQGRIIPGDLMHNVPALASSPKTRGVEQIDVGSPACSRTVCGPSAASSIEGRLSARVVHRRVLILISGAWTCTADVVTRLLGARICTANLKAPVLRLDGSILIFRAWICTANIAI